MSKERLEEIKKHRDEANNSTDEYEFEKINFYNLHVDWLIEQAGRVQELEEEVDRLNGALHYQLSQENIRNEENRKLRYKNKCYREAIEDIKKTWKNPHNPYNQLDEIHEIIKELEGEK